MTFYGFSVLEDFGSKMKQASVFVMLFAFSGSIVWAADPACVPLPASCKALPASSAKICASIFGKILSATSSEKLI